MRRTATRQNIGPVVAVEVSNADVFTGDPADVESVFGPAAGGVAGELQDAHFRPRFA